MIRKLVAAFVMILFAASLHATALAFEFIPVDGDKSRDYSKTGVKAGDIIRVRGYGQAPSNWDQRDSFSKTFARQAARMDALRQLAEIVVGVHVEPNDAKDDFEHIVTRISQDSKTFKLLEKNARQIGAARFSFDDGKLICEVTMELVFPTDWKR